MYVRVYVRLPVTSHVQGVNLMFKFMQRAIGFFFVMALCGGGLLFLNLYSSHSLDIDQSIFYTLSFGNFVAKYVMSAPHTHSLTLSFFLLSFFLFCVLLCVLMLLCVCCVLLRVLCALACTLLCLCSLCVCDGCLDLCVPSRCLTPRSRRTCTERCAVRSRCFT